MNGIITVVLAFVVLPPGGRNASIVQRKFSNKCLNFFPIFFHEFLMLNKTSLYAVNLRNPYSHFAEKLFCDIVEIAISKLSDHNDLKKAEDGDNANEEMSGKQIFCSMAHSISAISLFLYFAVHLLEGWYLQSTLC